MRQLLLTLTLLLMFGVTAFATDINFSAFSIPDANVTGSTVRLRIYASETFTDSLGIVRIGGTIGSTTGFFKEISCTVSSQTIVCPSFTIPSTVDSIDKPNVKLTAIIFYANGARGPNLFTSWMVPASPTATTWAALRTYNLGSSPINIPAVYLNAAQIQALINSQVGTLNDASDVIKGRAYLNVAPQSAIAPVAIGGNWGRLNAIPIDVSEYGDSLNTAVTSIGAMTNVTLAVSRPTMVTASVTVPANIELKFKNGGYLDAGAGTYTVTILGPVIAEPIQIFYNFLAGQGTVSFAGNTKLRGVYSQWWGLTASATTAATVAFATAGATPVFISNPTNTPNFGWALDFPASADANGSGHVNHGKFWPVSTSLGSCFWEAIVMPRDSGSKYFISDGYGGAHAVLLGFNQASGAGTLNKVYFSSFDGTGQVIVISEDGLMPNEWGHVAAAYDGTYIYVFVNGVLSGKVLFGAGTRQSPPYIGSGGGHLFIGGSNHNMFNGRLAMLRGWEGFNALSPYFNSSFSPETIFTPAAFASNGTWTPSSFFADYTHPGGKVVPDHSPGGYNGNRHPGVLWNSLNGIGFGFGGQGTPFSSYPLPLWVLDTTSPVYSPSTAPVASAGPTNTPPSTPVGAIIFDSFSRSNMTPFLNGSIVGLGNTEAGSAGIKAWTTTHFGADGTASFGILGGNAAFFGNERGGIAFVDAGTALLDVRVTSRKGTYGSKATGVVFRYVDRQNFWFAEVHNPGMVLATTNVRLGRVVAGGITDLYDVANATAFTKLRATASGTTITLYVDDGAGGWTQLHQATAQTDHQTATKVGIMTFIQSSQANGLARFNDFTVLAP